MIVSPREFVEEICPMLQVKYQRITKEPKRLFRKEEKLILDILDVSLLTLEEIYQKAKEKCEEVTINKVMDIVLQLQIKKVLKEEGGYYRLDISNSIF